MLNGDIITSLLAHYRNDPQIIRFIVNILDSFEQYHAAVFAEQTYRNLYGTTVNDGEEYRSRVTELDRKRTVCHNTVIVNVNVLNRLAENAGFPPVYEGVVSKERPYRRQVADAVLAYVQDIILNRT